MYKCSKEQHDICINNAKCILCDGSRLFKRPKWMIQKEKQEYNKVNNIKKKNKEGMGFEKRVQKSYNKKSNSTKDTSDIARRRPNSGSIWNMPGDIITKEQLIECKERGSKTSKGEKTITIQKSQLEKLKQEAFMANRDVWLYAFGFKEDNSIYVALDFDDLLSLINQNKELKNHIQNLQGG